MHATLQFNDCSAVIVAATYTRSPDLALQLVCISLSPSWRLTVHFLQFLEFKRPDEVQ